jgi:dienelactone hydrolase
VGRSLEETGLIAKLSYVIPSQASKEARTATGATFHSDGRLLVIHLMPEAAVSAAGAADLKFANLFCSVREKENPDGGTWAGCDQFLETAPQSRVDLAPIAAKYRVLIVPGFFSACASSTAPAFGDGLEHLRTQHGLTVETWVPPNDSSEANGAAIAKYLADHMITDQRKYIVLGYSKGAPDVQTALALNPAAKNAVAAFIAVAGAIGGSAIADILPAQANGWINRFKLGKCEGDVVTAFNSLKKNVRQAFLAAHPDPVVPSYSLPAVADRAHTSKALLESWQLMSLLARRQDSQLAYEDAILPGSTVLGIARADHLAVALPFDKATDSTIRGMADQGHYPRAALLETLIRFVVSDLETR